MRKQKILWGYSAEGVGAPSGAPQLLHAPSDDRSIPSPTHGFGDRAPIGHPYSLKLRDRLRTPPPPSAENNRKMEGGWGLVPRVEFAKSAKEGGKPPAQSGDGGLGPRLSRPQEFFRAEKVAAPFHDPKGFSASL